MTPRLATPTITPPQRECLELIRFNGHQLPRHLWPSMTSRRELATNRPQVRMNETSIPQ
ncbi:hypothetical protein TNCV_4204091, partial [Trichonephila clavipes]